MKRRDLIAAIEKTYPIDSQWDDTNGTGRNLLMEAIEALGWRNLPKTFLELYLQRCIEMEKQGVNNSVAQNSHIKETYT